MSRLTRAALLSCLLSGLALMAGSARSADEKKVNLQVGDTAPVFTATDDQGRSWKSADHVGKTYLVVYFYPGDFTPGCTRQAQTFRDNMNGLKNLDITVVGVSGDSVRAHGLFKREQKLNFTLLADEAGGLAKQFGVHVGPGGEVKPKDEQGNRVTLKRGVTAARWTFIIGKDGKIIYKNTKVNPVEDSKQVAAAIAKLQKK